MRACGAGLLTGETGGGGVDEAIFVRLVTHCLTTPTFLNLLLVQNVFCISQFVFPDANYSNPKQLSLKLSYTPPKSSYANPSLLNQSSAVQGNGEELP